MSGKPIGFTILAATVVGAVCMMLALAGDASAEYTLRAAGTAEGGGRSSAGAHELAFTLGQTSPIGFSANADYGLSSGLVIMLLDVSPPLILHEEAPAAPARVALDIEATVGDDRSGVQGVTVYYREGGISFFRQKEMQHQTGSLYSGSIPASAVTEKGLVYYIEARDNSQNVSRYPTDAPDSLVGVAVSFVDLTSAAEMPAGEYRMISLPGSPEGGAGTILEDDLGAHSRTSWRLGRWNPGAGCEEQCYDEYPNVADFAPGRGFWLIAKNKTRFDFSGTSVDIREPYAVELGVGWNQVGTPFAFSTDWLSAVIEFEGHTYALDEEHVVGGDTLYVEDNLVAYDGVYNGHQSSLEPWRGYWLYNGSTEAVDLLLYPDVQAGLLAEGPYRGKPVDNLIEVTISSRESVAGTALAGTSAEAKDGWDAMDHREPPAIGDYLRLVFDRPGWGRRAGKYMTDIRKSGGDGCSWKLTAESSGEAAASVDARAVVDLPGDWNLYVYDLESGIKLGAGDLPYPFRMTGRREFVLVAGTEEFVRSEENGSAIDLKPQIVSTAPNPFAGDIRVSMFVPVKQRVRIEVYTVEGRHVSTLADGYLETGVHSFTWSGDTAGGKAVSPGIYFLRFETDAALETRKILKVK